MEIKFNVSFDESGNMTLTSPVFSSESEIFKNLSNQDIKTKIDHWAPHDEWGYSSGIESKMITISTK